MQYIYMRPAQYTRHVCKVFRVRDNILADPDNFAVLAEQGSWLRADVASFADAMVSEPSGAIGLDVNPGQEQSARNAVDRADSDFSAALAAGDISDMFNAAKTLWEQMELAFSRGPQGLIPQGPPWEGSKP